jgi:APA family basic amino acid/polyamine antiporter
MLIVLGCLIAPDPGAIARNFGTLRAFFGDGASVGPAAFGAAMVGGLFSSDAWATVTFVATEAREPRRDLPRALALGAGLVILLYLLTNVAYLCELPVASGAAPHAGSAFARGIAGAADDRVATAAMSSILGGRGPLVIAVLVMISTFGCANGLILTGARVIWAMAHDRLFFAAAGRLNRAAVPDVALVVQGVWSALLTLSGTYSELLDYVIFTQLLFYALTVGAVFVMRRRRPAAPRSYRVPGYPWLPALYVGAALSLMADLLVVKPRYTWPGFLIALSAAPVYRMLKARA